MKSKPIKSPLQLRSALRMSEQRRLEHAIDTLVKLTAKHSDCAERDIAELHLIQARLLVRIKNQHVKDRTIAEARIEPVVGSY